MTVPAAAAGWAVTTVGRSVTMPRPIVKPEVVSSRPPNTLISTATPSAVQLTPMALTRTPSPVSAETTPATSRPSGPAPTRSRSGASAAASAATCCPATVAHAWLPAAGSATERTLGTYAARSAAAAAGSAATTIPTRSLPDASASDRPSVATSVLIRASSPVAVVSPITQMAPIR